MSMARIAILNMWSDPFLHFLNRSFAWFATFEDFLVNAPERKRTGAADHDVISVFIPFQ